MAKQKPKENRPQINQRIRQIRKSLGLTQQEAAQKMGMKYDTYAKTERCGDITFSWALKFAKTMGVDPSCFNDVFKSEVSEPLVFTPVKSEVLRAADPMAGIIRLYPDEGKNKEETYILVKENGKADEFEFTLNATEKSLIKTYRTLTKSEQKQSLEFINGLRTKRGI